MENQRTNPLMGYFRQPAIYAKLPSGGKWWGDGALDLPQNGEVAVYPMTTKDEVVLRTPDALLNGQGIVEVIQSCVPNIKDAWRMPSVDVDAILIAIRIATYGNNMEFDSKCPHCGEDNKHELDLGVPLSQLVCPNYSEPISYKDLKIKLRPQHYFSVNQSNLIGFEEQKIVSTLNSAEMDPQVKADMLTKSMQRLVDLGTEMHVASTSYIEMADGERVTDPAFIGDFYRNAESEVVRQIQTRLTEYASQAKVQPLNLQCNECSKSYSLDLTFDYANFFGKGF